MGDGGRGGDGDPGDGKGRDDRSREDRPREDRPLGDVASRMVREGARVLHSATERIRERGEDMRPRDLPREVVSAVANLGLRGKEEIMTLAAKEVRSYFEKLQVGQELRALMTEHSLEVQASIRLKPLAPDKDRA